MQGLAVAHWQTAQEGADVRRRRVRIEQAREPEGDVADGSDARQLPRCRRRAHDHAHMLDSEGQIKPGADSDYIKSREGITTEY